jgi:hypothetical protein
VPPADEVQDLLGDHETSSNDGGTQG